MAPEMRRWRPARRGEVNGKRRLNKTKKTSAPVPQEEPPSLRNADQPDPSSLTAAEVSALQSPAPQVLDQKEEDSKRETVDEE